MSLAGRPGVEVAGVGSDTAGLGRLGRVAFAYLVVERARPVTRDELADALWGDDLPRTWDTSLRVVISKLRAWLDGAGLGRDAISTAAGTYRLQLPADAAVDVDEAGQRLDAAQASLAAGDATSAADAAAAAAVIAGREFLAGATGAWVERRQGDLRDLRVAALEIWSDALLAGSDAAGALAAADAAVALAPLRESAHLRVIRAHAASGDRGEALRAYDRLRRALADELGLSPAPATDALYLELLGTEPDGDVSSAPRPSGTTSSDPPRPADPPGPAVRRARLPVPLSSFVGRTGQVDAIVDALRRSRIVTLTGTGGLGKTRLALEAGPVLAADLAGGAVMVSLAEVVEEARVAGAALAAVGLAEEPGRPPLDTLVAALADRRLLVVVDNCEHVVGAAAQLVSAVANGCPGVKVLATSREALCVAGEVVWPLPALSPEDGTALFRERVAAAGSGLRAGASPGATADEAGAQAVVSLCQRLDGIPLAIELAAARADVYSVEEIVERLEDRFRLLDRGLRTAPPRHQTLRAAIDWTYGALPAREREVLQAVSVFAGAFTMAAAATVAGEAGGTADEAIARLAARSLVVVERARHGLPTRYRLLESIQAYAAEQLDQSGARDGITRAFVAWAVDLAEEGETHLDGPDQAAWLDRLESDHANLRAALAAAVSAHPAAGLRLATALAAFWQARSHLSEGRDWLRAASARAEDVPPLLRARAQNAAALLAQRQGDYAAARSRLEDSLAIRREAGDRLGVAFALHGLGNLAALQHDHLAARALYEESLEIARGEGALAVVAAAFDNLGWVAHAVADFPSARAYFEEALAVRRELEDQGGIALTLAHLGDLAYQQGAYDDARAFHEESIELREALGDRAGRADSLSTLGHLALHDGDLVGARIRLEEGLDVRREVGDRAALPGALLSLGEVAFLAGDLDAARTLLGEAATAATANRDSVALAHVLVHQAHLADTPYQALATYRAAHDAAGRFAPDPVAAEWLEGVGTAAAATGHPDAGARLLGAAHALREAIGTAVPSHARAVQKDDRAAVEAALGAERFTAEWHAGRSMGFAEAIAAADAITAAIDRPPS